MKTIIRFLTLAILPLTVSCMKLDTQKLDSSNTVNSFKCYVYYNPENWKETLELDVLSGKYNPEKGIIVYTFPDDFRLTDFALSRCRLELSVPPTATVEELNSAGNTIGSGISGLRNLLNKTVYFNVVAADGTRKKYQAQFKK